MSNVNFRKSRFSHTMTHNTHLCNGKTIKSFLFLFLVIFALISPSNSTKFWGGRKHRNRKQSMVTHQNDNENGNINTFEESESSSRQNVQASQEELYQQHLKFREICDPYRFLYLEEMVRKMSNTPQPLSLYDVYKFKRPGENDPDLDFIDRPTIEVGLKHRSFNVMVKYRAPEKGVLAIQLEYQCLEVKNKNVGQAILIAVCHITVEPTTRDRTLSVNCPFLDYLVPHLRAYKYYQLSARLNLPHHSSVSKLLMIDVTGPPMTPIPYRQLTELQKKELKNAFPPNRCPICLDDMLPESWEKYCSTMCNHVFHKNCIDSQNFHLCQDKKNSENPSCPLCRCETTPCDHYTDTLLQAKKEHFDKEFPPLPQKQSNTNLDASGLTRSHSYGGIASNVVHQIRRPFSPSPQTKLK